MHNLAVIPARAGSTRLKSKNIYLLNGKPLIRWITEAVVESKCFDIIYISTDGDEIYDAVSDLPVHRHLRPAELATEKSTVLDAMLNIQKRLDPGELKYDTFSYFLPTCPLVNSSDIEKGISLLSDYTTDSVISMTEMTETLQLACLMHDNNVLPVLDNLEHGLTNSKFIKKYYKPAGAFYMTRWHLLRERKNFFKGNVKGVLLPRKRAVDINSAFDIKYAEAILNNDSGI